MCNNILCLQTLETFLRNKGGENLLEEYQTKKTLTDVSRRLLVNLAVTFLRSVYGNHPLKHEKISCAKSIVALFPSLRNPVSTTGGFVS